MAWTPPPTFQAKETTDAIERCAHALEYIAVMMGRLDERLTEIKGAVGDPQVTGRPVLSALDAACRDLAILASPQKLKGL